MSSSRPVTVTSLAFPFETPPAFGIPLEVVPGIWWLRLALPFRLNHVNVYLIEDGPGWAVLDTGIGDESTEQVWESVLTGPLAGRPITRIIVSHYHPDHVGMAGWLAKRTGTPVSMPATEYLTSLVIRLDPGALDSEPYRSFYLGHGLDLPTTEGLLTTGNRYLRMVTGLPRTFQRLVAGEVLQIGGHAYEVLTAGGHAPEQAMLYCRSRNLLLCADQVLARISPNIGVHAFDPDGDPLGIYLRSLESLHQTVPADTLILPGHNLPFIGLHTRLAELAAHHQARCNLIEAECGERPRTAAELIPVIFNRPIDDPHQMGFAFSEALAHVNYMLRQGRLRADNGYYRAR